jgi:hypothetical protein
MKFVNLFTGKKGFIEENYKSFTNLQFNNYEQNFNFFIFWDDDPITKNEEKILKENLKNYYYKKISTKKFKQKFKKDFDKIISNKKFKKSEKEIFKKWLFQYYILNVAFKIARKRLGKKSEKYIWQRIRPDIYVPNCISFNKILTKKNVLTLPGAKFGFGLNDYYCVGEYNSFKNYCNSIDLLRIFLKNSIFVPPEVLINIQLIKTKTNFTINRFFPTNLIMEKNKKLFLRASYSREKGSRYISVNYSNYFSNKTGLNQSDKLSKSILIRFFYYFVDFFQRSKLFIKNIN